MTRLPTGYKTGIDGTDHKRMTVSAVLQGSQPLVHLRIRARTGNGVRPTDTLDMSLRQANALVRALTAAIEAAELDPRRDGPSFTSAARADADEDFNHAGCDQT